MSPDSVERLSERIGQLEREMNSVQREMAGTTQRLSDVRDDVKDLSPLIVVVAEMKGAMGRMQEDVANVAELLEQRERERKERERERREAQQQADRDARNNRWALRIGLAGVMLTMLGNIVVQLAAQL